MAGLSPRPGYDPNDVIRQLLDTLGTRGMSNYGDPQEYIQSLVGEMYPLQRLREGITNEVDMGPDPNQGDPNSPEYSDEPYQVAGEVVRGPLPRTPQDLQNATRPQGSGGMMSIDRAGGVKNPYLDLLDILMYPQGGQIRK